MPNKNERPKKYEIKLDKSDIDIHLPNYSKLAIPPPGLLSRFKESREGTCVPKPEALMSLKLGALSDRAGSVKGRKDKVDVVGLLFHSDVDLGGLSSILHEYKHDEWMSLLLDTLRNFDRCLIRYLNMDEKTFADQKAEKNLR